MHDIGRWMKVVDVVMFDAAPVARLTFHVKVRGDVGTRLMSVTWLFLFGPVFRTVCTTCCLLTE